MFRVGVVGVRRGCGFLEVFSRLPECRLTAVCDLDEEAAQRIAEQYRVPAAHTDFETFLDEPLDIVVVATPPEFHVPQSVAALERDLHVLSEVPAANSLDECETLFSAAQRSRGKYMMAENCDYWAFHEAWREIYRQGRLGKMIYAEAEYIHSLPGLRRTAGGQPTWRAFIPPLHYCTHSLGPLLRMTGDRCVTAVGLNTGSNVDPEFGSIDLEVGIFHTTQGAVIKILCGFSLVREPAFHYYSVYGTRGSLETTRGTEHPFGTTLAYFDDVPHLPDMIRLPLTTNHRGVPAWAAAGGHGTAEYVMISDFVRCLQEDTPPAIDVCRALDYSLPGLLGHLSAEQGGVPQPVPSFAERLT